MTKLPLQDRHVVGVDGATYDLNHRCAVQGCSEQSTDRHHLWRRSFLIGDFWWVQLPDGQVVGNCVGLCGKHHRDVTTELAAISYLDEVFQWVPTSGNITRLGWQPPGVGNGLVVDPLHDHGVEHCPTCHQVIKPPKIQGPPEVRKKRRTWSIAIPKDEQENGADVLDTLIMEARKELDEVGIHYGDHHRYAYHVLTTAMALFVTHAQDVLANG